MVDLVTGLAVVADDALGGAETLSALVVAVRRLTVALTSCTNARRKEVSKGANQYCQFRVTWR